MAHTTAHLKRNGTFNYYFLCPAASCVSREELPSASHMHNPWLDNGHLGGRSVQPCLPPHLTRHALPLSSPVHYYHDNAHHDLWLSCGVAQISSLPRRRHRGPVFSASCVYGNRMLAGGARHRHTGCSQALYEVESLARVLTHTHVMKRLGGVVVVQILLSRQDLDVLCVRVCVTW